MIWTSRYTLVKLVSSRRLLSIILMATWEIEKMKCIEIQKSSNVSLIPAPLIGSVCSRGYIGGEGSKVKFWNFLCFNTPENMDYVWQESIYRIEQSRTVSENDFAKTGHTRRFRPFVWDFRGIRYFLIFCLFMALFDAKFCPLLDFCQNLTYFVP